MPKREFSNVVEFEEHLKNAEETLIDGTENNVERPKDADNQKSKYSGKKKAHTDIALVISDKKRYIYYVSRLYNGSQVDMGILKKEFPPGLAWFKNMKVLVDLGFVGISKLYEFKELLIGFKKPRKSKSNPKPTLTAEQKQYNRAISKERIYVEHAIGGMKKFRILRNKCRLKSQQLKERNIGVCAGLWNYQLRLKY